MNKEEIKQMLEELTEDVSKECEKIQRCVDTDQFDRARDLLEHMRGYVEIRMNVILKKAGFEN